MNPEELIMFIIISTIGIAVNLVFTIWLFHTRIGKYPEPLLRSENSTQELKEVGMLFGIYFTSLIGIAFFVLAFFPQFFADSYSLEGISLTIVVFTATGVLIPILFVLRVNNWSLKDLGITLEIQ